MTNKKSVFEQVAMPHLRALLRVARRLTRERACAEDLVQETYRRAWASFSQSPPDMNRKAWLFKIMLNLISEQPQKPTGARTNVVPAAENVHSLCPPCTPELPSFSDEEIIAALDGMQEEHRRVLLLAVVEGFTCKQTSDILAKPVESVLSDLSHARGELRDRLLQGAERWMQPAVPQSHGRP